MSGRARTASGGRVCSRCGGTDAVGPLPKRFACESCGQRGLCYACNVNHNVWCVTRPAAFGPMRHDTHARLTEPVLREHLHTVHGWTWIDILRLTYFQALIAHQRQHRKSAMAASA